jgi:hypothetical protein
LPPLLLRCCQAMRSIEKAESKKVKKPHHRRCCSVCSLLPLLLLRYCQAASSSLLFGSAARCSPAARCVGILAAVTPSSFGE